MQIEIMKGKHTVQVAELEKSCFSEPWSKKSLDEQLDNPRAFFVVATEGDNVLGYGGLHFAAGEYYIDNIAVDEKSRNTGIGEKLIRTLENKAVSDGGEFISLEVRASNPAVRLYKRIGFKELGIRRGFYKNPTEDALIMTKFF